jgi:hypothetical protein
MKREKIHCLSRKWEKALRKQQKAKEKTNARRNTKREVEDSRYSTRDRDRLRQLSKREHRALSKQISYMIKKEFEKDPESSKL